MKIFQISPSIFHINLHVKIVISRQILLEINKLMHDQVCIMCSMWTNQ
jgi:hypothetical protein